MTNEDRKVYKHTIYLYLVKNMVETKVDKSIVAGYLENRKDYLKRQVKEFRDVMKRESDYMIKRLDSIPVEMYPEFQKVIGEYKRVIEFLKGF